MPEEKNLPGSVATALGQGASGGLGKRWWGRGRGRGSVVAGKAPSSGAESSGPAALMFSELVTLARPLLPCLYNRVVMPASETGCQSKMQ